MAEADRPPPPPRPSPRAQLDCSRPVRGTDSAASVPAAPRAGPAPGSGIPGRRPNAPRAAPGGGPARHRIRPGRFTCRLGDSEVEPLLQVRTESFKSESFAVTAAGQAARTGQRQAWGP